MSLKELCRELNSPYATYKGASRYRTAFQFGLPFSPYLLPNQAVADSLAEIAVPELLEIRRGSELLQVACLKDQDPRISYSGKTASMRETIRLLNLPPFTRRSPSFGDSVFKYFARELNRTQAENSHFEEHCAKDGKMIMYVLKRLVKVYSTQEAIVQVLKKIAEKKQVEAHTASNEVLSGGIVN